MSRLLTAIIMALLAVVTTRAPASDEDSGWVKLFNGRDLSGWTQFVAPSAKPGEGEKTWSVKDGVIVCRGTPLGYLLSEKEYDNYVLRVQWRWPTSDKRARNSGVFVHVVGPNKIWPKGVEAQLMADHAGDFWLVDGAKLTVDANRQDKKTPRHFYRMKDGVEKPLGEWNHYEISCHGDTIKLVVNGQLVNEGTHSELTRGRILLQSEGAPLEFRSIEVKPLK